MPRVERDTEIHRLVVDGDWACALADQAALRRVCGDVAARRRELAEAADEVAEWAGSDMAVATRHWIELTSRLRSRSIFDGAGAPTAGRSGRSPRAPNAS